MVAAKKHHELVYRTVVGLIGGMGPEATLDIFSQVLRSQHRQFIAVQRAARACGSGDTAALLAATRSVSTAPWTAAEVDTLARFPGDIATARWDDQHHIPMLIFSSSQIPDRTEWLLDPSPSTPDPRPALVRTACALVAAGANVLAMPCNTAHAFADDVREVVGPKIELLHMPELTIEFALRQHAPPRPSDPLTMGLLATTGTIRSQVYHAAAQSVMERSGGGNASVRLVTPEDVTEGCQATVMESIYGSCGIKAGYSDLASVEGQHNAALLRGQQEALVKDGAACVLAGCTEIPLVLQEEEEAGGSGALVNPTRVLADMIVWRSLRDRM